MIRLDNVKRQFGSRVLFEGLSWLIPRSARIGLVGPNGAGKTTLLRILDGSEQPDAGTVRGLRSTRIGYLSQEVETLERGNVLSVVLSGCDELARIAEQMESVERELTRPGADADRIAKLTERYGELRHRFEHLDGDRVETRARTILSGLGVPRERFTGPLERLSGGWRMRVALARLLLDSPDLLLLDEPTNHLDLDAIDWLEQFLEPFGGAFIVVSHDRYFLNRMVRTVFELEHGVLTAYPGDYDAYLAAKEHRRVAVEQAAKQQAREIKKAERFIERFRYKNTKARQVQSRIRSLGKVERVRPVRSTKKIRFGFPPAPRSGEVVVHAESVCKRYGAHAVYDGLDLRLHRGDRVALVGPNGSGKSTLLKILAGRLEIDGGSLVLGHNVRAAYYAQHQLDELDVESTVLEEIERAAPAVEPLRLRKLAGTFLFTADDVDKRVGVLSGGEKARLALAKLLVRAANLLLLDEPTNHLDLRSREVLEEALNEYGGTLVVISHDRYFINRVATSVAEIDRGRIEIVPGDYDEFVEWKARRAAERPAPSDEARDEARRRDRKQAKRREAEQRNRLFRERRAVESRLSPIEEEIAELESRLGELDRKQADPAVYRDPSEAAQVARARAAVEARLERLYGDWEAIAGSIASD